MIISKTLTWREVNRILRLWQQTIIPPAITSALYFIILGTIIGNRVGEMADLPFIYFIAPGLILMTVIVQSYQNVCSVVYIDKFQKSIEELMVSPLSFHQILLGYLSGGIVRGSLTGGVVFLVAEYFLDISIAHPFYMLLIMLLTSLLFSLIGLINGLWSNSFDHTVFIPTFILTPLIYLGGVFYSVDLLPPMWQTLSHFNPIFYLLSLFRYAFYDIAVVNHITALSVLSTTIVLFYSVAYYILDKTTLVRK